MTILDARTVAAGEPPGKPQSGWQARLDLRFEADAGGARLVRNHHKGPLRLLKSLRSEDGRRLEAVIVHPPGGLVGGDSLSLDLHVGAGARVLVTTPGAQKWYRAEQEASVATCLTVAQGGSLEWLPQPSIVFDQARARQSLSLDVAPDASSIGWEMLIRGRVAMGERFEAGRIEQRLSISVAQVPLWLEILHADAGDRLFDSPLGWNGRLAAASVWCCAPALASTRLLALRDEWRSLLRGEGAAPPVPAAGATIAAQGLLLAKILVDDSEDLLSCCQQLWRVARTSLENDAGSLPRIWRT